MRWICFFIFLSASSLFATSLTLRNDSSYTLRAVIRAADGSFLGELVLQPQHSMQWNDVYGYGTNYAVGPNAGVQQNSKSKTPYTVVWQCVAGGEYSVCANITTGSLVFAQGCNGNRSCTLPKKTKPGNDSPQE